MKVCQVGFLKLSFGNEVSSSYNKVQPRRMAVEYNAESHFLPHINV